jgi:hypothetical protein
MSSFWQELQSLHRSWLGSEHGVHWPEVQVRCPTPQGVVQASVNPSAVPSQSSSRVLQISG